MKQRLIMILGASFMLPIFAFSQAIEWEQSYSIPDDQRILALAESDTGYLAFGQGRQFVEFSELLKIDTGGQLLWRKPVFTDTSISRSYSFDMVKVPDENSFYISGFFLRNGTQDYILKINGQGDTLWSYIYVAPALYQTTRKLIALKDKSVISVGYQQTSGPQEEIFARRLDSLGNVMWENMYALPGNQRAYDLTEMLDGSLIIAGSSDGDNLLMRIGFDGRLIEDTILTALSTNTGFIRNFITVSLNNQAILTSNFSTSNWLNGDYYIIDEEFNILNTNSTNHWLRSNTSILDNFEYLITRAPDIDSMLATKYILPFQKQFDLELSYQNPRSNVFTQLSIDDNVIVAGNQIQGSQNYWLAKISGVGEEWIPDRCAYQPPRAGFEYEYNYPILTLRDTSTGGLKYLDTVYTWEWSTSVGQSGTMDSAQIFFDTAITKTINVQLVISNWYGCTDTVNKTLIFDPNGITEAKPLDVKVYPNPVSDVLHIEFTEEVEGDILFEIFDIRGNKMKSETFTGPSLRSTVHHLPSGMYFYTISSGNQIRRGKIIKQ